MQTPRLILVATVGVLLAMSVGINGGPLFGSSLVTGLVNNTLNTVGNVVNGVTNTVNTATTGVTNTVNTAVGAATNTVNNLTKDLTNLASNIVATLTGGLDNLLNGLFGNISSIVSQIIERAANDTKVVSSAVSDTLQGFVNNITDQVKNLPATISNATSDVVKNLTANAANLINRANETIANGTAAVDKALNDINSTLANASARAAALGKNVSECFNNLTGPIINGTTKLISGKVVFLNQTGTDLLNVGNNIYVAVSNVVSCVNSTRLTSLDSCMLPAVKVATDTLRSSADAIDAGAKAAAALRDTAQQTSANATSQIQAALSDCIARFNSTM